MSAPSFTVRFVAAPAASEEVSDAEAKACSDALRTQTIETDQDVVLVRAWIAQRTRELETMRAAGERVIVGSSFVPQYTPRKASPVWKARAVQEAQGAQ